MNSRMLKRGAKYAACGAAVVAGVALLTLIFNVLGTISCAVLVGMMFGATRHPRWVAVPLSLVFPAAIYVLLGTSRTELDQHQVVMVASACLGAFWLTYAASAFLIFCEHRPPAEALVHPQRAAVPGTASGAAVVATAAPRPASTGGWRPGLEPLQGKWRRDQDSGREPGELTVLEIDEAGLRLSAIDAEGHAHLLATGEIRLRS